jgi:hypothetical protein
MDEHVQIRHGPLTRAVDDAGQGRALHEEDVDPLRAEDAERPAELTFEDGLAGEGLAMLERERASDVVAGGHATGRQERRDLLASGGRQELSVDGSRPTDRAGELRARHQPLSRALDPAPAAGASAYL